MERPKPGTYLIDYRRQDGGLRIVSEAPVSDIESAALAYLADNPNCNNLFLLFVGSPQHVSGVELICIARKQIEEWKFRAAEGRVDQ